MKPIVIIPALNPDEKLINLVEALKKMSLKVIVVNDGSDEVHVNIFKRLQKELQCEICTHNQNKGKGAAIKTGIQHAALNYPDCSGYVTADADGQHSPEDVFKIAEALEQSPDSLVLGTRDFSKKGVPVKSYFGNRITAFIFLLSTGKRCPDTQTGLRGIPRKYKALCLSVPGEKYEYEMNLLLEMGRRGISFCKVPIETIYINKNNASHFNPVKDSFLIYLNIFKYSSSSLISAAADLTLFTLFAHWIFGTAAAGLLAATVTARLMSGTLNFTLNKFWVFGSRTRSIRELAEYFILFCCQMMTSWLLVSTLTHLTLNLTLIKVLVDTGLFFISYQIQKNMIFIEKEERKLIS